MCSVPMYLCCRCTASRSDSSRTFFARGVKGMCPLGAFVPGLTIAATSKVTGKVLDCDDHRKLIEEAISDLDFSVLERND